jgi:hypothetical protein
MLPHITFFLRMCGFRFMASIEKWSKWTAVSSLSTGVHAVTTFLASKFTGPNITW